MKAEEQILVSNKADAKGLSLRISTIEKWLPAIATLWFFVCIDSILVWNFLSPVIRLFAAFAVIWSTMVVKPICITPRIRFVSFLFLCFSLWYILTQSGNVFIAVRRSCSLFPFLFVLYWKEQVLWDTYALIRKIVFFFAIGAAIVSVLSMIGLIHFIPHFTMPPQEPLHERLGYVYDVYGLFVTLHDPLQMMSFRACGMMKEPGHFAVILGFVYLIDRFQGRKVKIWYLICGLFTFSSNFILFVFFTEICTIIRPKNIIRVFTWLPIALLSLYIIYASLPTSLQDQVYYLAYGRNLEKVVDAASTSSSMDDTLDERASDLPLMAYERMSFSERLFGIGRYDTEYSLSDYRGMIMTIGYIGTLISVFCYIFLVLGTRRSLVISLVLAYLLILLHRSWMLLGSYVYFLAFLAASTSITDGKRMVNER